MGLFNPKNNTISDAEMQNIQRRAQKTEQASIFSAKAVAYRKQSEAQRTKADQS